MPERLKRVRLFIPMLLLLGLACGPCNLLSRQSPTPPRPIVISTEAAGQLESRIQQALGGPSQQQFILQMTDTEATSLLDKELAEYGESPVTMPVVWFTKGKIYATGRLVNVVPIATGFSMIASSRIQDGQVSIKIEQFSAGDVPLPSSVLNMISQSINETVSELQLQVDVTDLEILEGEVIIRGVRK